MCFKYAENIKSSGLVIYDRVKYCDGDLYVPDIELEKILARGLVDLSLTGMPIKTRSKWVKGKICEILGYPVPKSFKKTQPRFIGQNFDVYIQKSNNLQIWNEEVEAERRYVIIKVSENERIEKVKVVGGDEIAKLDTTGTLTKKYQARLTGQLDTNLLVSSDTSKLKDNVELLNNAPNFSVSPTSNPTENELLSIEEIFKQLTAIVGVSFSDPGSDQERLRGAELHKLVCRHLGYQCYEDDGQFPDVKHQLLEIKLQTSITIDLGLVLPTSTEYLDLPAINNLRVRHCDVRYAIFYAETNNGIVEIKGLFLTAGASFFTKFQQFKGNTTNSKIQIPLPANFFD